MTRYKDRAHLTHPRPATTRIHEPLLPLPHCHQDINQELITTKQVTKKATSPRGHV